MSNERKPGPDHPIAITPTTDRVTVTVGGEVIADSRRALTLRESSYPAVQYIPREDVRMDRMERTDDRTHCPYKGDASYFTATAGSKTAVNVAWSYEHPYDAVAQIAGYLAFYPDRVDAITLDTPAR